MLSDLSIFKGSMVAGVGGCVTSSVTAIGTLGSVKVVCCFCGDSSIGVGGNSVSPFDSPEFCPNIIISSSREDLETVGGLTLVRTLGGFVAIVVSTSKTVSTLGLRVFVLVGMVDGTIVVSGGSTTGLLLCAITEFKISWFGVVASS